ncbi:MAG: carboxyl transferase domain-containing protein [Dehalococcoidales bacterium]|nr:carboxyl transferase domain-containing protein [Dehalococcoidales bacterium]
MDKIEQQKLKELSDRFGVPVDFVEASQKARQATTMKDKLAAFNREKELILKGDVDLVTRLHGEGKLTAREHVGNLLDRGSGEELDLRHRPYETGFDIGEGTAQGDGVIISYGTVNNKPVTVWAQDSAVLGGTVGVVHARKITMIMKRAIDNLTPLIGIIDSGGIRAHDAIQYPDFYSFGAMAYFQTMASGVIPKITMISGPCTGEMSVIAGMSDFVFMVKDDSHMTLMPAPAGTDAANIGDPWNVQAKVGACDVVADNEIDCLQKMRQLLSYLPANNTEKPARVDTGDDPDRRDEGLLEIVPIDSAKPYNMYKIIGAVVDNGEFFEIKRHFARNLITGFARLDGYTTGIIANSPQFLGGCMTLDAADKMSRFVRFCDAFNIPLVWLADTPAFLPAIEEETRGLIRHGSRMIMAISEATVPKITVGIRKHYGGGRLAMPGLNLGGDLLVSWPTLQSGLMGAEGAVSILYGKNLKSIEDESRRKEEERKLVEGMQWSLDLQVREASEEIIDPRETRPFLIRALKWMAGKNRELPPKKHENIRV